ncbi:MAG: LacI family DNA-binding transcriptional regulator [Acidimicrobiia bacterium]
MKQRTVMKQRITIRDVGRAAGVSVGTVSKALNGTGSVAPDTAQRVLAAADRLGYRPSRAAQGLVGGRSFQVGYGLPQLGAWGNPTLNAFLHAMVGAAAGHGLEIVLFRGQAHDTAPYDDLVRRGVVDGFVVSDTDYEDARVDHLLDEGVPFVTFGRTAASERHFWVDVDGGAGTAQLTERLIERGHSHFGVIAWPEGSESGDLRVDGVLRTLRAHGHRPPAVARSLHGVEYGREAMAQLLDSHPDLTAVIAVEDELAIGAIQEARSRRLAVGVDVDIAGFDDIPSAAIIDPPLTTVRQPFDQIGGVLVDMLAEALSGVGTPRGELLTPIVIERASTGVDR